jgi:hypothetical protein
VKDTIPYFLISLIPAIYYFVLNINTQSPVFNSWEYFLVQVRTIFIYLKPLILPYGLKYIYIFDVSSNPLDNFSWLAIVAHILASILIFKIPNKYKWSKFFFLMCYIFFISESTYFPIYDLAFEHRTYLPFLFFYLGAFYLLKDKISLVMISVLLFAYISLNIYRNKQITPPYKWVSHSIMNSLKKS